jgi:hypothetical protein
MHFKMKGNSMKERFRHLASSAVRFLLANIITPLLPAPRVIYDRDGKSAYLSRWYLRGRPSMPDGSDPFDKYGNPKKEAVFPEGNRPHIYLHKFHRGDQDQALHRHPWFWSFSIVLAGGYQEERRVEVKDACVLTDIVQKLDLKIYDVENITVLPFSFNYIAHEDYHRVDLLERDCWSIFVVGPRVTSWDFWDRETGKVTPWREFLEQSRAS